MRSDDGNCALIVEQLADAGLLLGRQLGDVGGEVGADGHAFLNGWTLGDLLGPALDVLELLEVLALHLVVDGPRIADHVGDRVLLASEPGAVGEAARCEQTACAVAYSSFHSSDCTYQRYVGPRRLCEKGVPEASVEPFARVLTASASRLCDPDGCARRYRSFDPLTCTYQPHGGGSRRMCEGRHNGAAPRSVNLPSLDRGADLRVEVGDRRW
jgi:hypothetical protein